MITALSHRFRLLSALECAIGAFFVIGHNVYRIVPNEVIVLFILGWISIRLRNGGWRASGLARPSSWKLTIAVAALIAVVRIVVGDYVILPLTATIWPPPVPPSIANEIRGNVTMALVAFALIWTFAAFGEELSYRGYLMRRTAEAAGGGRTAWWVALIVAAVLFGYGHYYKGPAGMLDSGVAGLLLGLGYLLMRHNLWVPILAHGFIDTIGVIAAYLGWE